MTDKRSHMHPETLQLVVVLKLSKSLWPSEFTTQETLDKIQEQSESEDEDQDDDDEDATTKTKTLRRRRRRYDEDEEEED